MREPMAEDSIRDLLARSKVIAVVGLSSKPYRPSHGVARYLQSVSYRIIPVNPNETEVLGQKSYPRLEDVPVQVDIVNVFRRSACVAPVVDSAIAIGARAVWLQEGVIHEAAAARAREARLEVVMDRCILKEHTRRLGEANLL